MSEFLFIIPAGWTVINEEQVSQVGSIINDWIAVRNFVEMADDLKLRGYIPQDVYIVDAKFFNGEVLALQLAPQ